MDYRATTMTPNKLYTLLSSLTEKELKLLLVIIRQTAGWIDPVTKKRKERDYISHRFFIRATGLSSKSVSSGLNMLIQKNLIAIENKAGQSDTHLTHRRARSRKFYRCLLFEHKKNGNFTPQKREILRTTKLTHTKLNQDQLEKIKAQYPKLTDRERYHQIIGRAVK